MSSVKLRNKPEVKIRRQNESLIVSVEQKNGSNTNEDILKEIIELYVAGISFEIKYDDMGEIQIFLKNEVTEPKENITISVGEAAEILEISPQLVRRYCKDGKITGVQSLGNSGRWSIIVDEKIKRFPNWINYQEKQEILKENSKHTAEMLKTIVKGRNNVNL